MTGVDLRPGGVLGAGAYSGVSGKTSTVDLIGVLGASDNSLSLEYGDSLAVLGVPVGVFPPAGGVRGAEDALGVNAFSPNTLSAPFIALAIISRYVFFFSLVLFRSVRFRTYFWYTAMASSLFSGGITLPYPDMAKSIFPGACWSIVSVT